MNKIIHIQNCGAFAGKIVNKIGSRSTNNIQPLLPVGITNLPTESMTASISLGSHEPLESESAFNKIHSLFPRT